jgi:DNA-binding transcriptional ArsR family regulator
MAPRSSNTTLVLATAMNSSSRTLLWYLLVGTRGGPNRARILEALRRQPHNANQLSEELDMDYRTVRHHLALLERNQLILRPVGRAYASPYELAPDLEIHFEMVHAVLRGASNPIRPSEGHARASRSGA